MLEPTVPCTRYYGDRKMEISSAPIRVNHPSVIPAWELSAQRVPVGSPGDYKPSLALLPTGELVMVAFHRTMPRGMDSWYEVSTLWHSHNGGRTWSKAKVLDDVIGREQFLTCTSDGTLFMTSSIAPMDVAYEGPPQSGYSLVHRSTDGGKTWQRTVVLIQEPLRRGIPYERHPSLVARNVVELPNGTLLLGVSVFGPQATDFTDASVFMWASHDGGVTWEQDRPVRIEGGNYGDIGGFFAEGYLFRNSAGKLLYWRAYDARKRNYKLPDERVDPSTGPKYTDQVRRLVWWESVDDGLTWTPRGDFGDYGQMYPRVIKLRSSRLLMTYTQRDLFFPLGLRARLGGDDGETWNFDHDQIVLEGRTPWGMRSGGGFGNTVELQDGRLVSCYSYLGTDDRPHVEVVRWAIPASAHERIVFFDRSLLDLDDPDRLVLLYDWSTSTGARMAPRDFPYLKSQGPDQTEVFTGAEAACHGPFVAELRIRSAQEAQSGRRGVTLLDPAVSDWRPYAAFAIKVCNSGTGRQRIFVGVHSKLDFSNIVTPPHLWISAVPFDLDPGQTGTLFAPVDELRDQVDAADIRAVSIYIDSPDEARLLVSPAYLLAHDPPAAG